MKIFSNEEIRAIDKYTIEQEGVPALELVERVAQGVACEIMSRWTPDRNIMVFAGWGNNGADALKTAEILLEHGYKPEIFLLNANRLSDNCKVCRDRLLENFPDVSFTEGITTFFIPEIESDSIVIDGLFGSGLNKPLAESINMIIQRINESGATVISIDVPSGLNSDWNAHSLSRNIVHASLTLAVEFPRLAFFIDDNADLIGEWRTIEIGLSQEAVRRAPSSYYLVTRADIKHVLKSRPVNSSKADFGSALICAGSYGMMGAAVLATKACLRAGAGKVTCYAPKCGYHILQTAVPCAMFIRDTHEVAISEISPRHDYGAVAIGPGIGTHDITINALENYLKLADANSKPVILDADALNCLALRPIMLNYLPVTSVITPHAAEFDRIFGHQPSSEARLRKAIEVANFHNIIIVLKGHHTAIVRPDGKVLINSSGTPALATPGSGDVLTGVIAALMAQGYRPETAAHAAVYIHGVAGEIAEQTHGQYGVTAMDVADCIGMAIKQIMS